jgi:hypothetical protein
VVARVGLERPREPETAAGGEIRASGLDVAHELGPAAKPGLAGEGALGITEARRDDRPAEARKGGGVTATGGAHEFLRLTAKLPEIGRGGKGGHSDSSRCIGR